MKAIKRTIIAMLSMFMMVAQLWFPQQPSVRAATENLAYGKPVTVSGVEGGYVNETTLKYPQINHRKKHKIVLEALKKTAEEITEILEYTT